MSQAHTPGPWTVGPRNRIQAGCLVLIDEGVITARPMNDHYATKTEQNFNARLISAAPELLNALELAQATIERLHRHAPGSAQGTLDVMRDAIAKAKGAA